MSLENLGLLSSWAYYPGAYYFTEMGKGPVDVGATLGNFYDRGTKQILRWGKFFFWIIFSFYEILVIFCNFYNFVAPI